MDSRYGTLWNCNMESRFGNSTSVYVLFLIVVVVTMATNYLQTPYLSYLHLRITCLVFMRICILYVYRDSFRIGFVVILLEGHLRFQFRSRHFYIFDEFTSI